MKENEKWDVEIGVWRRSFMKKEWKISVFECSTIFWDKDELLNSLEIDFRKSGGDQLSIEKRKKLIDKLAERFEKMESFL